MTDDWNNKTFGSVIAGLNYAPIRTPHRASGAIFVRTTDNYPYALDLEQAKELYVHLGDLIEQVEEGIKPKPLREPEGYDLIVKFPGYVPAVRRYRGKWRFVFSDTVPYTWDELLEFTGNPTEFEVIYQGE